MLHRETTVLTDAAYMEIIRRATLREEQGAGITLADLNMVADQAGIRPEHVAGAINEILAERNAPRRAPSPRARRVLLSAFGRLSAGLGFGVAMVWQSGIQGPPLSVMVHLGALGLVWVGARLTAGTDR